LSVRPNEAVWIKREPLQLRPAGRVVQIMARSARTFLDAASRSLGTSIFLDDATAACSF